MADQHVPSWNGHSGNAWADLQPMLDRLYQPFEKILSDAVVTDGVRDVLDVGCGTGATTLALAERLGTARRCTGIDISQVLVDIARHRAEAAGASNARFVLGDGQSQAFAPKSFDAVASRFGVMFFADPVAAFTNIHNATRPRGGLTCIAWRPKSENPFQTTAERAAEPLIGRVGPSDPQAPGQFGFADADRVRRILAASGWDAIDIAPIDVPLALPRDDLAVYIRRMGYVAIALPDLEEKLRAKVTDALDQAFAAFLIDDVARFNAACWMIRARAA